MKRILFLSVLCCLFFSGCKKALVNALDDAIIQSMSDGQWVITSFTENGNDLSAEFSPYKFQYHTNKTVDAIKNGILEKTGTWDGSATNKTTWAEFPGGILPISLLNGSWKITNNTLNYVKATQVTGTATRSFRLDKL